MLLVASFYRFVELENYQDMKEPLQDICFQLDIKGTILLAEEGINSSIAGTKESINQFFAFLNRDKRLKDIKYFSTSSNSYPFQKLKVRLKKEIVRFAMDDIDLAERGHYIDALSWDQLISDNNVKLIDVRNNYETDMGTFEGSVIPDTESFRDFPKWTEKWIEQNNVDKSNTKVAMVCTGGIRCEKSTAYFKSLGFRHVYHLQGGILSYLKQTGNSNNKWLGKCFVFDDRVFLNNDLAPEKLFCSQCRDAMSVDDLKNISKGKIVCQQCK